MEWGRRGKVCKLVGCVVVTEEEQNKLLMGVGLAGGSHIKHKPKPTARAVGGRYRAVQRVRIQTRGYMFKGQGNF